MSDFAKATVSLESFSRAAPNPGVDGRALVLLRNRILVAAADDEPILVPVRPRSVRSDVDVLGERLELGRDERARPIDLLVLDDALPDERACGVFAFSEADARFVDPRLELGRIRAAATRQLVVTAIAVGRWARANQFCAICGAALLIASDGRTKSCINPAGAHRIYPRLDPAAIVLVHDGDRALLGRQATWPGGLYSTLAGFVEPGESVEACVAREVLEDVGQRVGELRYVGSEAWPFPRSLVFAFEARALAAPVVLGPDLEDARWFTRDEVRAMQADLRERRPHFDTIARRMIAAWLERSAR